MNHGMRGGRRSLSEGYWILIIVLFLGIFAKNGLIVGSSLVLLLLKVGGMDGALLWVNRHGVVFGLFILILALLVPVATEQINLNNFVKEIFSITGLAAIVSSALGAYFAAHGVRYMQESPTVLVGLVVGSVVGVVFLRGVPSGPLIAAGTTALLVRMLQH